MKTNTKNEILAYIRQNRRVEPKHIIAKFPLSPQVIHRHLKKLTEENAIIKTGAPPRVWYDTARHYGQLTQAIKIDDGIFRCIAENYLNVSPQGEIGRGWWGFDQWCQKQKLDPQKTAREYCQTLKKYNIYKNNGLVNGLPKIKASLPHVYLDELYYLDFYAIERFGKTKLGALTYFAKQSQSRELMKEIATLTKDNIFKLIQEKNIDAIGLVPPTVKRAVQILTELKKLWAWDLPEIKLFKNSGTNEILVAQKSLSKLADRIENAEASIAVEKGLAFKNVLLIDDAVGSGATLNETAHKIRSAGMVTNKIIGLAITGSFSGFDVINEI